MPHVIPADTEKFSIDNTIESKVKLPVAYITRQYDMLSVAESTSFTWRLGVKTAPEKPRFIISAFQTAKDSDQTKNPSTFDDVNLKKCLYNAKLRLNYKIKKMYEKRDTLFQPTQFKSPLRRILRFGIK